MRHICSFQGCLISSVAAFAAGVDTHVFVLGNQRLVSYFWGNTTYAVGVLVANIYFRGLIPITPTLAFDNRLSQTSPASTAGSPAVALVVKESSDLKLVEGFGRGLMADIKGKSKFLKSDISDGFSIKVRSLAAASACAWLNRALRTLRLEALSHIRNRNGAKFTLFIAALPSLNAFETTVLSVFSGNKIVVI